MVSNSLLLLYISFSLISKGLTDPLIRGKPVGKVERVGKDIVVKSDNKYPYVVHIAFSETIATKGMRDQLQQCGGVLIGAQTVLTAAHCIKNLKSETKIEVSAGTIHLLLQKGQQIAVEKYKTHENYVKSCEGFDTGRQICRNDIALLWLQKRFVFSSGIQTAVLASKKSSTRKNGMIFGWGLTETKKVSSMLRQAEITITSRATCKTYYPNIFFDQTKLCVISETLSSTVCNGDSGGPLVSDGVVRGIASFGRTACDPRYPSIFTNVAIHENWIKSNVHEWSIKEFNELKFEGKYKFKVPPKSLKVVVVKPIPTVL